MLPSNILPSVFVQVTRNNNGINEETLDGRRTTHDTTLVLYQRRQFGPAPKPRVYADQTHATTLVLYQRGQFGPEGKKRERFPQKNKKCPVGYCPVIDGSPTEFSTVYTVTKNVQSMMAHLGLNDSVFIFDLAIYVEGQRDPVATTKRV